MYEMVAGKPPFTGENPVSIAYKQVHDAPQPLVLIVADKRHWLELEPWISVAGALAIGGGGGKRHEGRRAGVAFIEAVGCQRLGDFGSILHVDDSVVPQRPLWRWLR